MAIKAKVMDGKTYYLYCQASVVDGTPRSMMWDLASDRHQEKVYASGASNEQQLLEIDDSMPDEVEDHPEWVLVNATVTGQDPEGNDMYAYDAQLDTAGRDAWYTAELKAERDELLDECDWFCMRHRDQVDNSETPSLSAGEYTELLNYRKALRDWPADEGDIYARTAPTKPAWM